jgi:acetolactate decarboxylase
VDVVDHRLVGAVHLDSFRRDADEADFDAAFQTSTIEALLDGRYEGDLTIGELLRHGDLGIGTIDRLDGELIVVDGEPYVASADGAVRRVEPDVRTPFAVVVHHRATATHELSAVDGFEALTATIDGAMSTAAEIAAVRVDGSFTRLVLRSVARQVPPYPPLHEVVGHQHEWEIGPTAGSLVGFRFPDATAGIEVAGWHLHYLAHDRSHGGHVIDASLSTGRLTIDTTADLHVELPKDVELPRPDRRDRRAEMRRVEGRADTD